MSGASEAPARVGRLELTALALYVILLAAATCAELAGCRPLLSGF